MADASVRNIVTRFMTRPSMEAVVAVTGFAILCVLVLTKQAQLLEPDDLAYRRRSSLLSHGHILLSNSQYASLQHQLAGQGGIAQWVHLPDGKWISEKNPGYPFFAVPSSRFSASFAPRRSFTGLSAVRRCTSVGADGSGVGEGLSQCSCSAAQALQLRSPGGRRCRRSPMLRSSPSAGAMLWALLATEQFLHDAVTNA